MVGEMRAFLLVINRTERLKWILKHIGDTLGIHCIPNKCNADILHKIIKSVGVQYKKEEIFTSATEDTFCIRIMEIVSAILAVDTTAHAL